jgi:hypothetical protein
MDTWQALKRVSDMDIVFMGVGNQNSVLDLTRQSY